MLASRYPLEAERSPGSSGVGASSIIRATTATTRNLLIVAEDVLFLLLREVLAQLLASQYARLENG
jgi:hypothetical protein